jgi:hypothetical protein
MGHTFGWTGVLNDPVRRGSEISQTLQASRSAAAVFDGAAAYTLERCGADSPFAELAETAFREIVYELALQWDRRTTVTSVSA